MLASEREQAFLRRIRELQNEVMALRSRRKITALATDGDGENASVFASCDDGTCWTLNPSSYQPMWYQMPSIPQPDDE